jgi:hypothetical protein
VKFPAFVGPSYTSRSATLDLQRTLNLYPELDESGAGKNVAALYGTPGLRRFATLAGDGPVRGLYTLTNGRCFAVRGNTFYEVYSNGESRQWGTLSTNVFALGQDLAGDLALDEGLLGDMSLEASAALLAWGPVEMQANDWAVILVDGANGYFFDFTDNVWGGQIFDEAFYGADRVAFIDEYVIFNRPGTTEFYLAALSGEANDTLVFAFDLTTAMDTDFSLDWGILSTPLALEASLALTALTTVPNRLAFNALDFASKEGAPDRLIGHIAYNRELWLFGNQTTEVWVDSGNPLFPFERLQGTFFEMGLGAVHSLTKFNQALLWLDADERGNAVVWLAQGFQASRVSTHAVETALKGYARLDDALGWGTEEAGHFFFWLTFPTANATWVYDLQTQLWHERAYQTALTASPTRHRANCHTFAFGQHLVGDYNDGRLYVLDLDTYTDDGDAILRLRRAPYVSDDREYLFFQAFELDCQVGVGNTASADPLMTLRWSNDAGQTWSSGVTAHMGTSTQTLQRVRWRRLGRGRSRVFEVSSTEPVRQAWINAHLALSRAAA